MRIRDITEGIEVMESVNPFHAMTLLRRMSPKTNAEARQLLLNYGFNLKGLIPKLHQALRRGEYPEKWRFWSTIPFERGSQVRESANGQITSDVMGLLVAAQSEGMTEVDTEVLVSQLKDMGHSVTPEALVSHFENDRPDLIQNLNVHSVTLSGGETSTSPDEDTEENRERDVSKQAMDNVRQRAQQRRKTTGDVQL